MVSLKCTVQRTFFNLIAFLVAATCGFFCDGNGSVTSISMDRLLISVVSGPRYTAPAGEFLAEPITVRVGLESGASLPGRPVEIRVVSGEGEVLKTSDTTDQNGTLSFRWMLGMIVGKQCLRVSSNGAGELVVNAEAQPKPGTLTLITGSGQRAYPRDTLALAVVAALRDDMKKPVAGRVIVPKVRSGGGTVIPTSAATDTTGCVRFRWIVGDAEGEQKLELLAGTPVPVGVTSTVTKGSADGDVTVFNDAMIEYSSGKQTIQTAVSFPTDQYYSVQAELNLRSPCVSCGDADCDPWDRIGNISIEAIGGNGQVRTLELIKFISPFGNSNVYTQDLSSYSSLLRGTKTVKAYISTFLGKWFVTLKLRFHKSTLNAPVTASYPLFYSQHVSVGNSDTTITLNVPENNRVQLAYRSTGHNSQGRNCDEFCQKVNELYVDGALVKQIIPWRTDCSDLLPLNRCGSVTSVPLSRAGWCPGDIVRPYIIDVGRLSPGAHTFRIRIPEIEPNGGYFRTSLDLSVYR